MEFQLNELVPVTGGQTAANCDETRKLARNLSWMTHATAATYSQIATCNPSGSATAATDFQRPPIFRAKSVVVRNVRNENLAGKTLENAVSN